MTETTAGILLHEMSDHQPCFITIDSLAIENYNNTKYVTVQSFSQQALTNFAYELNPFLNPLKY